MLRVKDIINESRVNEEDVLKRNPLQPTYRKEHYDSRDKVIIDDAEDDIETLDGRINARGRAEPLRTKYVDAARKQNNRKEICDKYIPILNELGKKLDKEGFWKLTCDIQSLIAKLEDDVNPEVFDMGLNFRSNQRNVRRPIYVGDPILHRRDYYGHEQAWSR